MKGFDENLDKAAFWNGSANISQRNVNSPLTCAKKSYIVAFSVYFENIEIVGQQIFWQV